MYEVTVVFTDGQKMKLVDVASVQINESDYAVRAKNGNTTHFPKANVFSFNYRKVD